MKYDAVIIGGGAAGLFCAIEAGKRGRRVCVLEHNDQVGRKIVISGGGRCNFTNTDVSHENFVSANIHFSKSALAGYTPQDFIELVKSHRIAFFEKKLGQLFCRDSSREIVEMLLKECARAKVEVRLGSRVSRVEKSKGFSLQTNHGNVECESLVIATGGLSFPKIGATGFGYEVAEQFSIARVETRPSLVGLMLRSRSFEKLAGISTNASVKTGRHSFRENILFTHRGLSGPAILQISNYWLDREKIVIDLLPDIDVKQLLLETGNANRRPEKILDGMLPSRLLDEFVGQKHRRPLCEASRHDIDEIADRIKNWSVEFSGTEGYDRAEVTRGGVSTSELSSKTMESKKVSGLYFIGEVVDVTGWLGGYNFQWAWSSGYAAGQNI